MQCSCLQTSFYARRVDIPMETHIVHMQTKSRNIVLMRHKSFQNTHDERIWFQTWETTKNKTYGRRESSQLCHKTRDHSKSAKKKATPAFLIDIWKTNDAARLFQQWLSFVDHSVPCLYSRKVSHGCDYFLHQQEWCPFIQQQVVPNRVF